MKMSCLLKIAIILIFCFSGVSAADEWKDESGKGRPKKHRYHHDDRDFKERPYDHGHREYKKGPDYHKHHGYRKRPHAKDRHYEHHDYKGHRYDYHGHWLSWEKWERYAKKHPRLHEHGHYYRENAHLMFRFCEPGTDNCLFFSIGK